MSIPDSFTGSQALQLIQAQGWNWKVGTAPNVELETCPYCLKIGYGHLYIEIHGENDEQKNRDGLHQCHRCGKGGNLHGLRQHLGITIPTVDSFKSSGEKKIEPLPDIDAAHEALLADEGAMDYLMNGRGFSRAIIQKMKIGFTPKRYFRECGEVRALIYPYLVNGNCVFVHFRTLPTMPLSENKVLKAFSSPTGWDATLYNGEILREGLKEIVLVEGEPNTIAAMDHGVTDIAGVPGANFKKADWIGTLDTIGIEKVYVCYDNDKVGQKAAKELASRVGVEKCWRMTLPDFQVTTEDGEVRKGKDLNEWFVQGGGTSEAYQKLKEEAALFDVDGVSSSSDAVSEFEEELLGKGAEPAYRTAWASLNKYVGFDPGDVIDILAPEKIGKGGNVTTPVLLADGTWKKMGELLVGDKLASVDGQPSVVTGVFPRGVLPLYRVTFSDGRSTETTADHLWKVAGATEWERQMWRVYTTDAIANEYTYPGCRRVQKLYVPLASGDFGEVKNLPLDPWVLGAMIGDGCMTTRTSLRYCSADQELLARMTMKGCALRPSSSISYRFVDSDYMETALSSLGLWGHRASSKFIPKSYLEADKESRWELLRGLMDTDGTAGNKTGTPSYCTISKQLAEDFVYLVRSLGGMAKVTKPQKRSFRYKGELRQGQDAYIIVVRLPEPEKCFTLQRKLDRVRPRTHQPRLTFKKIEYAGDHEAVCIAVSHPSKLYVTDDFIVTHNTTFGLNLMEHMVDTYGEDGVIICLEMTRAKLARKWISHLAQVVDNVPQTPEEGKALTAAFLKAVPLVKKKAAERKGDLYFCLPRYKTTEDIYKLIRDCIRRYGVKWVMIDNLQRMADTTPAGKNSNRTQHLSEISKVLSQMAKEYTIQMVRILQPHRIGDGKMVTTDNVDGSSQIAKDCDATITLHRNRVGQLTQEQFETCMYIEQETSFDDKMLTTVGLSRYSGGGATTLQYHGATSTVTEFNIAAIAAIKGEVNKNVGYENQLKALSNAVSSAPDTSAQAGIGGPAVPVAPGAADDGGIAI